MSIYNIHKHRRDDMISLLFIIYICVLFCSQVYTTTAVAGDAGVLVNSRKLEDRAKLQWNATTICFFGLHNLYHNIFFDSRKLFRSSIYNTLQVRTIYPQCHIDDIIIILMLALATNIKQYITYNITFTHSSQFTIICCQSRDRSLS